MQNDFYDKLSQMALKRSIPFCMGCYQEAKSGTCPTCGSDDLGRLLPGHSCDWGLDFIIEEILRESLTPVDLEEAFEESFREVFSKTTKVAWLEFDTATIVKELDQISWRCAVGDFESQEAETGTIVTFNQGQTYYWAHDLEAL